MSLVSKKPEKDDRDEVHEAYQLGHDNSPADVCHHCARCPTGTMGGDSLVLDELKRLAGWIEKSGGDISPPSDNERTLFSDQIYPTFRRGFFDGCATPANCRICSDSEVMCYHERQGLEGYCPHTSGSKEIY